jgi:hypothetical protein
MSRAASFLAGSSRGPWVHVWPCDFAQKNSAIGRPDLLSRSGLRSLRTRSAKDGTATEWPHSVAAASPRGAMPQSFLMLSPGARGTHGVTVNSR